MEPSSKTIPYDGESMTVAGNIYRYVLCMFLDGSSISLGDGRSVKDPST